MHATKISVTQVEQHLFFKSWAIMIPDLVTILEVIFILSSTNKQSELKIILISRIQIFYIKAQKSY